MLVKDLLPVVIDKSCIYVEVDCCEFNDLYQGNPESMPKELSEMKVRTVGAKRKGILDVRVV